MHGLQAMQEQKEIAESRFSDIDERWSRVEDALRIQNKERGQDLHQLNHQLNNQNSITSSLEHRKVQMVGRRLGEMRQAASETKENLQNLFETEAQFRSEQLDIKNAFIQDYSQESNVFNKGLQNYITNKMGDLARKLQTTDAVNCQATQESLRELKEEAVAEAKQFFSQEKDKHLQLLNKVAQDSTRELDKARKLLREGQRQRTENEARLRTMVAELVDQLGKACSQEELQGETAYDSLLRMLEECCDRIQQAQLR